MWEKIKKILGRNVSKKLLPLELAKDLCEASFQESVDILNEVFGTLQPSRSNILPKCFFELFAYYQYLVLIYVANILDLKGERLNLYGGELNVACGEIAKKNIEYGPLIERAITDQQFHHLVSAYVAGNKSISGLSDERFSELLKFVGFEKGSKDPL